MSLPTPTVADPDIDSGDSGILIHSITSTVLEAPPSCIEFSTLAPDLFVIGTYSLDADEVADKGTTSGIKDEEASHLIQSRRGSLMLFQFKDDTLYANPFHCRRNAGGDYFQICRRRLSDLSL